MKKSEDTSVQLCRTILLLSVGTPCCKAGFCVCMHVILISFVSQEIRKNK